ncbi:hypothetical protein TREMEDRAFT_25042 [Tremella mesenterica DSM 1558]|uniref:uncharacterized protein n=1 Tax=Tremella mesenterica (strain ATCC 24925 / CBS 8224 / DSM 1558 / NBRC 9311 / NRRL Y-6157 / RJB 2259-6 / UBC 559-6) TaxID=578456 RepID=UPI0003F498EE|nr:uncharacterized protein TREMEDRAFT_25042 [Tremella mesenterica DSM 1558]EIW73187.1 hypothetical protein TREMEDRAFT_25042 [Tremella mesenterica DSM 1558]
MLQSLQAADEAHGRPSNLSRAATIHLVRPSIPTTQPLTSSSSSDNSVQKQPPVRRKSLPLKSNDPRQIVSEALHAAEKEEPPPRRTSGKYQPKESFSIASKRYLEKEPDARIWNCCDLFNGEPSGRKYALIILNQPITRKDVFLRVWNASEVRYCADGGANRLYDLWNADNRNRYLPNMIKGDLDSIRTDVHTYYAQKGVSIKHDGSEYATDLMKCISEIEALEEASGKKYHLILMGGLSGRIDQSVHTMFLLHKMRKTRPETFVISGESLAWTLDEGSHLVEIDHTIMGQTCGLLPVGVEESYIKTEGLKWDLGKSSFSTSISTSNHLLPPSPLVYIRTSRPILWTIEIKSLLPSLRPRGQTTSHVRSTSQELSSGLSALAVGVGRLAKDASRGVGQWTAELGKKDGDKEERGGLISQSQIDDSVISDQDDSVGFDHLHRSNVNGGHRDEEGWQQLV